MYVTGKDKSAIHPDLRAAIFGISVRYGTAAEFSALKQEWQTTTSVDGKDIALRALARLQTPDLLSEYLTVLFNDVATQDIHVGAIGLAANSKTRHGLWLYIKNNFDDIRSRLGENMVVLDRFLQLSLKLFVDRETEKDIAQFFEGKDNSGYDRGLAIVSDTILERAAYKERDAAIILEWLKENGHA